MKYFTHDMILRYGSEDDTIWPAAAEEWEQKQEMYLRHLNEINLKLPRNVRLLLKRYYLHDARVSTIALAGSTFALSLQLDGHDNGGLQLSYRLVSPMKIHRHPEIAEGGTPFEWLYDEIDLVEAEPGIFQHNILLTKGTELELHFRNLSVKRFSKMLSPSAQRPDDSNRELELLAS